MSNTEGCCLCKVNYFSWYCSRGSAASESEAKHMLRRWKPSSVLQEGSLGDYFHMKHFQQVLYLDRRVSNVEERLVTLGFLLLPLPLLLPLFFFLRRSHQIHRLSNSVQNHVKVEQDAAPSESQAVRAQVTKMSSAYATQVSPLRRWRQGSEVARLNKQQAVAFWELSARVCGPS